MSEYRPVRVSGDELVHFAATDRDHTIGCVREVLAERTMPDDDDLLRCGECLVEWMVLTGKIRFV